MNVSITITGDKDFQCRLSALGTSINDMPDAMRQIGQYLTAFYAGEVFASQGGVINKLWPRLSVPYETWKAKNFPGRPPLIRSGVMQNSFKFQSGSNFAIIRNSADYFRYHQLGTRKMPARVMFAVDDARAKAIGEIVRKEVMRKVAAV
ncbi:phage virion morphogenesis protein [Streptomyces sp. NPDC058469]|uniref:phage virion morphogenesis protein n=1 Tax=Streptomyces sp. NPDC058469 TaxID=3346514 RepID=UPI00364E1F81